MINDIKNISTDGVVTFTDRIKGGEIAGDKQTCEAYGYTFTNGRCKAFSPIAGKLKSRTSLNRANKTVGKNNIVEGFRNLVTGYNNIVQGMSNIINGFNNHVIGKNLYGTLKNSIVYGNYNTANRARNIITTYEGTTTNAVATELFNGDDNRFLIDETYEAAYFIKATLVSLNPVSNTCAQHEFWTQFKYVNSTLTRTSAVTISNELGDTTVGFELDAVADTPDYIRVRVTGKASETWYHNAKINITEVKYA